MDEVALGQIKSSIQKLSDLMILDGIHSLLSSD